MAVEGIDDQFLTSFWWEADAPCLAIASYDGLVGTLKLLLLLGFVMLAFIYLVECRTLIQEV